MTKRSDKHSNTAAAPEQGASRDPGADGSVWTMRLAALSGSLLATTALPAMAQVGDFGLPSPYGQRYEPFGPPQVTAGGLTTRSQPQRLSPEFFPTPGGAQPPSPVYRQQPGYAYYDYYGYGSSNLSPPPLDYGVGMPVAPARRPRSGGTFASSGRLAAPATGSVSTGHTHNAITDRVARHFESYRVTPRYKSRAAEIERDLNARAYYGFFLPYLTSPNASTTSSLDVTAIRPGVPRVVPQGSFEGYDSPAPAAPIQAQALRLVFDPTGLKPPPLKKPHSRMEVGWMEVGTPVASSFGQPPGALISGVGVGEPLVISSANAGVRKPPAAKPVEQPPPPPPAPEVAPETGPEPIPEAEMAARQEPSVAPPPAPAPEPAPRPEPAPEPPKVALPKTTEPDREPAAAPQSQPAPKPDASPQSEAAGAETKPDEVAASSQPAPKEDSPETAPKTKQPTAQPTEDRTDGGDRPDASILFDGESRELSEAAHADLMALVQEVRARETARVQLRAYAEGSAEDINRARRVSLSRAIEVRLFLIEQGVPSTRIDVRALGNTYESGNPNRVDIDIVQ